MRHSQAASQQSLPPHRKKKEGKKERGRERGRERRNAGMRKLLLGWTRNHSRTTGNGGRGSRPCDRDELALRAARCGGLQGWEEDAGDRRASKQGANGGRASTRKASGETRRANGETRNAAASGRGRGRKSVSRESAVAQGDAAAAQRPDGSRHDALDERNETRGKRARGEERENKGSAGGRCGCAGEEEGKKKKKEKQERFRWSVRCLST